jgi:hypothetical protein
MNNDDIDEMKMTGFGLNDKGEELKMADFGLIMFVITSQSTGQCKAMFRFASHCFALPVI